MTKYCSECGKPNEKSASYCFDCGNRFEEETTVGPSFCGAFGYSMKRYFRVGGRATRLEYWGWLFVYFILSALLAAAAIVVERQGLPTVYLQGTLIACAAWFGLTLIPGLALAARRLHDTNKTGWRLWLPALFLVGGCVAAFYSVNGGSFNVDVETWKNAEFVKNAALGYAQTLKAFSGLQVVDYVALGCWALGLLSWLGLAIRLCFVGGTQEANRYGDRQTNP